ncbi:WD40 repeat-like protein [Hortaea werneckii]|nr:WD40 repeat-like protein [Hortaea werneckii]
MPSTSPGAPSPFAQILPGAPTQSLQAISTLTYRYRRYIVYISGKRLNILSSPTKLIHVLDFKDELVAVTGQSQTGKVAVASKTHVYILEPVTEGWNKIWWEKALLLRREDAEDEIACLSWGGEGEIILGGSKALSLYSTIPRSRRGSPIVTPIDGEEVEERRALWSKRVAAPLRSVAFSPTAGSIATCTGRDRLVKIWRRLSFEDGLFDYTYLAHGGIVTHIEWRPLDEHAEERRGSGIGGRHEEDPEVLYTIATDGMLRMWRTGGMHDLDILVLHTTVDLVAAIPQSPSLSSKGKSQERLPPRYCFPLPADKFSAAVTAATARLKKDQISHSLEHLKEILSKSPDVIIALDGQGRMSAWGLQSIGHKRRIDTPEARDAFHVAHQEGLDIRFGKDVNVGFEAWLEDDTISVLAHRFDGHVEFWQGDIETFLSPSAAGPERLKRVADWTGQSSSVEALQPIEGGQALISRSESGDVAKWNLGADGLLHLSAEQVDFPSERVSSPELDVEQQFQDGTIRSVNDQVAAFVSVDGKQLLIVAVHEGYIEHRASLKKPIKHLSLLSPAQSQSLLAVGFDENVEILVQGPYEHGSDSATWSSIKDVSVSGLGLTINALEWLKDGALAIATSNGLLLSENNTPLDHLGGELQQKLDNGPQQIKTVPLVHLARKLKQPLPAWHPGTLMYLVHSGKPSAAINVFCKLLDYLKFWSEDDHLPSLLDFDPRKILEDEHHLELDTVRDLVEQLESKHLPAISDKEQKHLICILHALAYISEHMRGLDTHALRYLFHWKLQLLQTEDPEKGQPNGTQSAPQMQWREIAFAYHSTTQQPLLDILVLHYDNKITWDVARSLGITAWLADKEALERVFESLAQATYRQTSPPDPINASLYFLALHKKPTLLSLWRIATWHREQRATMNFLKRDFSQPDARTAAKKNAYALMGKRRFEYAAAFFLLAEDPTSASNILAGQCEDVMLAIAVGRLYSGDGSPALRKLLQERLMPDAERDGDRWLLSWGHALLRERQQAAQALVLPHNRVRSWEGDEPTTLILYRELQKSSSQDEYQAVLRAARVFRRMGLWLPALDLVSNWQFLPADVQEQSPPKMNGVADSKETSTEAPNANEPPSLLDGYDMPPPEDNEKAAREAKAAELLRKLKEKKDGPPKEQEVKKPPPTQFKEPDANSLLDSFGF